MKRLVRFYAFLTAFLSVLTLIQPRGLMALLVWVPKMVGGGLSPLLVLGGGLTAFIGRLRRDPLTTWLGLLGAGIAIRHIARVTAGHDGFEQAFGGDWQERIEQQAGMLKRRYQPILLPAAGVPWQQNVVFDRHWETGEPLLADIWQPPTHVPASGIGIIYLHGSAWHYADKDVLTRPFFRHLANQGHVVMDVAYTLAPKASLLPMVADVKRAIAWLKSQGAAYGVNPERIVLMGGSAGAHLALLAAYTPNQPALQPADVQTDTSVRAVISYYGASDLEMAHETLAELFAKMDASRFYAQYENLVLWLNSRLSGWLDFNLQDGKVTPSSRLVVNLCGGTPADAAEMYRLGSPLCHVGPHCPPTLLLQGAHDVVFATQGRPLYRALREAGVPVVYVELPDTDHAFDLVLPLLSPGYQAATYDTERFLALMM
jgi:acetyl esterase/lipase